jgi:D-arabinose 1-dehydrogenase-like Zn-dependent alcohol dehydrogenase
VTTYDALRNASLLGGDLVAMQGVGGLGHLGVQFARLLDGPAAAVAAGTSHPGVFAAADVRSGSAKRVASAVGEGSMAVMLVHEYRKER